MTATPTSLSLAHGETKRVTVDVLPAGSADATASSSDGTVATVRGGYDQ